MSNAAAADTFRENFTIDEETGAAANNTSASNNTSPSSNQPQAKSRIGWIITGTVAILFIVGLSVSLSDNNVSDGAQVAAAQAAPRAPIVPSSVPDNDDTTSDNGPAKETALFTSDDTASDNGAKDTNLFTPEESVGDSALLNWPEIISASSPTMPPTPAPTPAPTISPTNEPSTSFEPTNSPSDSPSMEPSSSPSASPSNQPTLEPSESPTDEPTNSPTSSPSTSPSKTPTASPFNFSSWTFSAFGLEPSASPSKQPTPAPSTSPSKRPTSEPTKQPTPEPSASPSETPTNQPSKQPTPEPSKKPTPDPSKKPTPEPSKKPTPAPSKRPTPEPSKQPTPEPSKKPTPEPSNAPSKKPTFKPSAPPTQKPVTASPTIYEPFFFGDEFDTYKDLGINVSRGLSVKLIAQTGKPVQYANGGESRLDYHAKSDGAGIIPMNPDNPLEDGYVYVVNSEESDGDGGVYGIYFDKDGNLDEYKALLTRTTRNCGGGLTPWNTWVSCEEHDGGQCWQVDPVTGDAKKTKLGGNGGSYESVAVDNTNTMNPVFFTTEDDEEGAMRRFVANGNGWNALHSDGDETFLHILDNNSFEWTTDEGAARDSAARYYRNSEGVSYHEGKLYFMAKKDLKLLTLDLENMTYETETTGRKFYGEGSFGNQPDQNMFGPTRKYIYFCEDGGSNPGVYARYGNDGTYFTMFQAISGGIYDDDETVGIALSPDNKRFYAGIQHYGVIFEFTRDDGLPFE